MTDRIEAAAAELRPLLQEFLLWAPEHAPDTDPDLVGHAALWHRLSTSTDVGRWRRKDLRTVLLDRLPEVVDDPDRAAEGMLPAVRAYLTFLSATGRLAPGSDPLPDLLTELDDMEDDFIDAMEDILADEDGELADDEDEGLGDFEPFADALGELPPIRLRPDAELAAAARAVALIASARDLAVWVGTGRVVGDECLLTDDEIREALAALGMPEPEPAAGPLPQAVGELWNIWNLAVDLEFITPDGQDTVSVDGDAASWPFDDDEDVLDVWMLGLHSVDYGDPELDDDELTFALGGLTRAILVRLLLAGGERSLPELREELERAAAELDDLGAEAWAAAIEQRGDALAAPIAWLVGYGMVTVEGGTEKGTLRLTPLGVEGVIHLLDDADIEIDARPAIDAMTAHDLLTLSFELPEEDVEAEFAAWLKRREPEQAAKELLEAAAGTDADALVRVQAASMVGTLGAAAVPAWRDALEVPSLRPYATTHLTQLGVDGAPEPAQADTHWLILDMWAISAGLGRQEFVSSLHDIGPAPQLCGLLDVIWRVPHPHLEDLLTTIAQSHPDKQVVKAAKRALSKAKSR